MGSASYVVTSFLGGEWSKFMQGRTDSQSYRTAMDVCLNIYPTETGAAPRRPGFAHAAPTRGGAAGRVLPFDFQVSAPYNMEFTDGFLRMFAGSRLATSNDAQTISSISTANPAVVATVTAHGWATADSVYFSRIVGGSGILTPLLLNRQFKITVIDATHFSLADAVSGTAIDGAALGWATPTTPATVSRILEIVTSYTSGRWSTLRTVQANISSILLHGEFIPYVLTVDEAPTATADAEFTFAPANLIDGPHLDPVAGGALANVSAKTGVINLTLAFNAYVTTTAYSIGDFVTYSSQNYRSLVAANQNHQPDISPTYWEVVSAGLAVGPDGFQPTDVGRHIRLASEPALWVVGTTYAAGASVTYNGIYWTSLLGSNTGNTPGVSLTYWQLNPTGATWTWGKITGLLNLIDRALAGSVSIGTMISNGGLAAGFDGNTNQASGASAALAFSHIEFTPTAHTDLAYIGKNYSGAAAQALGWMTVYPSTDNALLYITTNGSLQTPVLTLNLRGKQTAPASSSDGTLLGTYSLSPGLLSAGTYVFGGTAPITILSTDTTTAWKYVWVEYNFTCVNTGTTSVIFYAGEIQFFNPPTATGNGVTVQIIGPDLLATTPIRNWRLGVYSSTTGWPTCGSYHGGRLWLGGVVGNRVDASKSNELFNFAPTDNSGQVLDNSGISVTFNSSDVNIAFWMISDDKGLLCGTQAGEWLVHAPNNGAITPTNIAAHRYTRNGCANIAPIRTGLTLAFVQKFKRKLIEYFADVYSGRFASVNLSLAAKHLTKEGIEEIAYQQELTPILWARCGDGSLIGTTYKRETLSSANPPAFNGWHRHQLGSDRFIESICVGPNVNGLLDTLALVTNDPDTGIRHVELMTDLFDEDADSETTWFLDNAIEAVKTGIVLTSGQPSGVIFSGLWHLNGETVDVWIGGLDCGSQLVTNGSITVPFRSDPYEAFTANFYFTTTPPRCVVGFSYTSQGRILRPAAGQEAGAYNGPAFAKEKRTHQFGVLLHQTNGISFGTEFGNLRPALFRTKGGKDYAPGRLFSGIHWNNIEDGYSFDSMLAWEVTRPYPGTVLQIGGFLNTQDR